MKARWYDNDQLRRMERILDQTYADLGIDAASPYARHARELLARLLFEYEVYRHTESAAAHVLRAKARLHGFREPHLRAADVSSQTGSSRPEVDATSVGHADIAAV